MVVVVVAAAAGAATVVAVVVVVVVVQKFTSALTRKLQCQAQHLNLEHETFKAEKPQG